ncbi:MAG: hypothetical protein KJN76_14425 [Eudoraea sp.]|nr:hypothetical protein [Eudoraea sp.]
MFFQIASRLRFLFSATNQHGVHSPFVFKYLTECLYSKPLIKGDKIADILLKSIGYFKAKNLYISANDPLRILVLKHYPELRFSDPPYEMVYMDIIDWSVFIEGGTEMIRNNSVILLSGLYKNSQSQIIWRAQTRSQLFNVSIDLFYCGLLFVRKEQNKEHFKVRI